MTLRRSLWISFVAAIMPAATLIFALFASDTDWAGGAAAIVLILVVLMAAAMILPIAAWGLCAALLLRRVNLTDGTTRLLFVASFAALFLLVAALPPGPDGGGKIGPAIGQGFFIGITTMGELLRQTPWIGFGWVCVIAAASFTPPWLGLLAAIFGAWGLGSALPDQREPDRRDSRVESGLNSREIRRSTREPLSALSVRDPGSHQVAARPSASSAFFLRNSISRTHQIETS